MGQRVIGPKRTMVNGARIRLQPERPQRDIRTRPSPVPDRSRKQHRSGPVLIGTERRAATRLQVRSPPTASANKGIIMTPHVLTEVPDPRAVRSRSTTRSSGCRREREAAASCRRMTTWSNAGTGTNEQITRYEVRRQDREHSWGRGMLDRASPSFAGPDPAHRSERGTSPVSCSTYPTRARRPRRRGWRWRPRRPRP